MLSGGSPTLNYYGPSTIALTLPSSNTLTLVQRTNYPRDGRVEIEVRAQRSERFELRLRIPGWSASTTVRVGDDAPRTVAPGQYLSLIHICPEYTCFRAAQPIKVDGVLDDPSWQGANLVHLVLADTGEKPRQATEARLLWDDDYLYVSFVCQDTDIWATMTERDAHPVSYTHLLT